MPRFASAELARDSPLDELAMRHSVASLASTTGQHSLSILDAFPLPSGSEYGSQGDSSASLSPATSTPEDSDGPRYHTDSSSPSVPKGAVRAEALRTSADSSSDFEPRRRSSADPALSPDPAFGPAARLGPARGSAPNNQTYRFGSSSEHAPQHVPQHAPQHVPQHAPQYAQHSHDSGVERPAHSAPGADHSGLPVRRAPDAAQRGGHMRETSVETICAGAEAAPSPVSRTQERYQRYGHSFAGSHHGESAPSPGSSPVKKLPPRLNPTWRALGPSPGQTLNSAPMPAVPAVMGPPAHSFANAAPPVHAPQHARHPSQPAFRVAPALSLPASPALLAELPPAPAGHPAPLHLHGPSYSWDSSAMARVRVPDLQSSREHIREGCVALSIDSRLTLEHWAAAATRYSSAAANLLIELGWAEHWIPWTIITGLVLPPNLASVDAAELQYGAAPCAGRIGDALHSYGVRLRVRQQEAAALQAFELAESLGSTEAAFSAAHLCMKGGRQVKKDVAKARILLRRVNNIV